MSLGPDRRLLWKFILGECTQAEIDWLNTKMKNDKDLQAMYKRLSVYKKTVQSNTEHEQIQSMLKKRRILTIKKK